jgi:large subunit ribosomal protein L18e
MLHNSIRKIKTQKRKKTNPYIVETIAVTMKNEKWKPVSRLISSPSSNYSSLNLSQIDVRTKEGDNIVIVGKVLGQGELSKKIRIAALSFSSTALEKAKKTKSEMVLIKDEIKKNPKFEGVKILK